jgi:hypothetical protein
VARDDADGQGAGYVPLAAGTDADGQGAGYVPLVADGGGSNGTGGITAPEVPLTAGTSASADCAITGGITAPEVPLTAGTSACAGSLLTAGIAACAAIAAIHRSLPPGSSSSTSTNVDSGLLTTSTDDNGESQGAAEPLASCGSGVLTTSTGNGGGAAEPMAGCGSGVLTTSTDDNGESQRAAEPLASCGSGVLTTSTGNGGGAAEPMASCGSGVLTTSTGDGGGLASCGNQSATSPSASRPRTASRQIKSINCGAGGCIITAAGIGTTLAIDCGGGGCGVVTKGALGGADALHNNRFGKVHLGMGSDGLRRTAPPAAQSVLPGDHPRPGGGTFQGNVCPFAGGGGGLVSKSTAIDNAGGGGALGKGGPGTAMKYASDALTKSASVRASKLRRNPSFINGSTDGAGGGDLL